jgi:hypothetical protein
MEAEAGDKVVHANDRERADEAPWNGVVAAVHCVFNGSAVNEQQDHVEEADVSASGDFRGV